ncbi:outer membrane transport energization protein ExbD [Hasllibacter halocynthiae]|uniref:Outer membrane transport energization protein ExbD n=1 Tax=Hasllibacter halocynthiae TaxID=595589 RepID=A0A2T0X1R6_9RHOB|nr:biopolymer transporter ExbD [Hasllibacter halocynthiae]PRY92880.1 outer membrane transport energization protein ExbD [Hasllibacter halocynthiae]
MALTPLVDVIFLLLLFFMLTSTFTRFGTVPLAAGGGGAAAAPAEGLSFLRLTARGATLDGAPLPEDPAGALRGARAVLSTGPDVDSQTLVDLLARLRTVPDLSLTVLR